MSAPSDECALRGMQPFFTYIKNTHQRRHLPWHHRFIDDVGDREGQCGLEEAQEEAAVMDRGKEGAAKL